MADFDLDVFLSIPRLSGLACSPGGARLVTAASLPHADGTRFVTALWEVDPAGERPPRRLTRSGEGEAGPRFTPDGDLLFTSARPIPDEQQDEPPKRLWLLPATGGEARVLAEPPGGVLTVEVAGSAGIVAITVPVHPGAEDWDADRAYEQGRTDAGVTAQLLTDYPMRRWDRWVGVRQPRLHAGLLTDDETEARWNDCTPEPNRGLEEAAFDLTPDGQALVTTWWRDVEDPLELVTDLVVVELDDEGRATGRRVLVAGEPRVAYAAPVVSPDGRRVACLRHDYGRPDRPGSFQLVVVDLDGGEPTALATSLDRWPQRPVWAPDGTAIFFTADDGGHTLPFRVDCDTGAVRRLAPAGAYTDLVPAPDGSALYALRSDVDAAPRVVALEPAGTDQEPRVLYDPADDVALPGRMERVEGTAADGATVRAWLVLPAHVEGPAPLVVFIHGGPFNSWAGWHWRWNPHLLAAQGWAVLMPDPGLSTGYGQAFVGRGWGRWGAEPYTDLMAITDAVERRADIDETRTAAMGGSFGGYMANWVAGHTDRFSAIITHASLWDLEAFHGTTDLGVWWEREFGDPYVDASRYAEWSPRRHVGSITTPMLVIHGERDYRVPVSEGLTLWTDLRRHGVPSAYLHFPDEHHWVLKPGNIRVWYDAVVAWLGHHVLEAPFERPPHL